MCTMDSNNLVCLATKLRLESEFGLYIFFLLDTMKIDVVTWIEIEQSDTVKFSHI